jgi:hypothetical protein
VERANLGRTQCDHLLVRSNPRYQTDRTGMKLIVVGTDSMRAMVDQDIPLNAGCLVPLNSMSPSTIRIDPKMEADKHENDESHHPRKLSPLAFTRSGRLRR